MIQNCLQLEENLKEIGHYGRKTNKVKETWGNTHGKDYGSFRRIAKEVLNNFICFILDMAS